MSTPVILFINLSKAKCLEVYPVVKTNADRHFRIAKILSESKEHANAVSHLILGTEELIKALALFMEGKGFNFSTMPDYKKIFFNHSARHSVLKEFFSVWIFCKSLVELKKKKTSENSFLYGLRMVAEVLGAGVEGVTNYVWWNEADRLKQNGFYVDYKNGMISPESIDEIDYSKALKITTAFRKDIRVFISALSAANEKDLKGLRSNFETTDIKNLIAEGIARSQQKK